jgi:hypothetical protein
MLPGEWDAMPTEECPRRQFLKIGVSTGAGLALCGCLSGSATEGKKKSEDDPYRMTAYCCQRCDQCDLYRFRQCSTCKWRPEGKCQIKRCAIARGVPTCAHCDDLPSCDKEFWKKKPEVRKLAEQLRAQLRAGK